MRGAPAGVLFTMLLLTSIARAEEVDLQTLFQKAMRPPTIAYSGRMVVTVQHGGDTQSAEMDVAFRPPQESRYDIWGAGLVLQSTVIDNGKTQWTYEPLTQKAWSSPIPAFSQRPMSWRQARLLLQQNYAVHQIGEDTVAGRKARILEFIPQHAEQPVQQIWIDPESGVLLKTHASLQDGSWDYSAVFTRVAYDNDLPESLFVLTLPPDVVLMEQPVEPDFFSAAEVNAQMNQTLRAPALLPQGFRFESGSVKNLGGTRVAHLRYSDGLSVVSVFESTGALPWQIPSHAESFRIDGQAAWLTTLQEQKILGWTDGPLQGVVLGTMSREALVRMVHALIENKPPILSGNEHQGEIKTNGNAQS